MAASDDLLGLRTLPAARGPGDTAEDGLARVDEVLEADPWRVIVELGRTGGGEEGGA